MARSLCLCSVTLLAVIAPGFAVGGDWVAMGYKANTCWPRPYIYPDRAAVVAPFHVMADNGWRRQNLLGDHHFDAENQKLTTAGELKLRWVLTQAPMNRRTLILSQTFDQEVDAKRLEAVQLAASKIRPDLGLPSTQHSHIVVEGRAAETIDSINTRFRQNMPAPILPAATSASDTE